MQSKCQEGAEIVQTSTVKIWKVYSGTGDSRQQHATLVIYFPIISQKWVLSISKMLLFITLGHHYPAASLPCEFIHFSVKVRTRTNDNHSLKLPDMKQNVAVLRGLKLSADQTQVWKTTERRPHLEGDNCLNVLYFRISFWIKSSWGHEMNFSNLLLLRLQASPREKCNCWALWGSVLTVPSHFQ